MTKVIITGGGTGGHVFPAIAIARAIIALEPGADILFVGASGKMEMEKVPAAGFKIIGLPVAGFHRSLTLRNLWFPYKLLKSLMKAGQIIKEFRPDVVVGVGGYASGPVLRIATKRGIPSLLQEQNSFPGVTNRILAPKVQRICVAYDGMASFFPKEKIILTGNPIRQDLISGLATRAEALSHFNLNPEKKTLLVIGGSLGARTINEALESLVSIMTSSETHSFREMQILWQTGKFYFQTLNSKYGGLTSSLTILPFIDRMDMAYTVADMIVSRAGAISISELCAVGKPVILIPSPNVAEDHQTRNALALVKKEAAILLKDQEAVTKLPETLTQLIQDQELCDRLSVNIRKMALPDAAEAIAREALGLVQRVSVKNTSNKEKTRQNIYFLGIGGIGMSALARYFMSLGARVSGYDKTPSPLTARLEKEGMEIHYEEDISKIPSETELVIHTPAVPVNHAEYQWFLKKGIPIKKRAEVLGMIASGYKTIAVAGTHGKTTTTTMIAHMLKVAGLPFVAFPGGIPRNYGTNYLNYSAGHPEGKTLCVVEADEYDRSFLQLSPDFAVITSADADHLDIYGGHETLLQNFSAFTSKIKQGGSLYLKSGADIHPATGNDVQVLLYGSGSGVQYSSQKIVQENGTMRFDFIYPQGIIRDLVLGVPGLFNVENAIAALAVGTTLGIGNEALKMAFSTYQGVKRRFEIIVREPDFVYIDDYAHHPEELRACISTARQLYPDRRLTGVFQPHLYSRTRDLADGFARSLELLDELLLLEIYPARELPIEGITSKFLLDKINLPVKSLVSGQELVQKIASLHPQVLLTMGAGDIDQFTDQLATIKRRYGL
jgi:UDP-N-acetylmuramate--alanine ligase